MDLLSFMGFCFIHGSDISHEYSIALGSGELRQRFMACVILFKPSLTGVWELVGQVFLPLVGKRMMLRSE